MIRTIDEVIHSLPEGSEERKCWVEMKDDISACRYVQVIAYMVHMVAEHPNFTEHFEIVCRAVGMHNVTLCNTSKKCLLQTVSDLRTQVECCDLKFKTEALDHLHEAQLAMRLMETP